MKLDHSISCGDIIKSRLLNFSLVYSYVQKSTYRIDGVIAGIMVLDRAIKSGNTKAMRR